MKIRIKREQIVPAAPSEEEKEAFRKAMEYEKPVIEKVNALLFPDTENNSAQSRLFGRMPQPVKSKAVKEAAKNVDNVYKEIGISLSELDLLIPQAKRDAEYKRELAKATKRTDFGDFEVQAAKKQAADEAAEYYNGLIEERNELIDTTLPPDKYEKLVNGLVKEHGKYKSTTNEHIAELLTTARNLFIELYDETEHADKVFRALAHKLNSSNGDKIIEALDVEHDALNNATLAKGSGSYLITADVLTKMIDNL